MPTGGVNLASFFKAGAIAAGLGGSLINPAKLITGEGYTQADRNGKKILGYRTKKLKQSSAYMNIISISAGNESTTALFPPFQSFCSPSRV